MKNNRPVKVDRNIFAMSPQIDQLGGTVVAIRRSKIPELFSKNYSNGFDQRKYIAEVAAEEIEKVSN
jgi:hypothetical protein